MIGGLSPEPFSDHLLGALSLVPSVKIRKPKAKIPSGYRFRPTDIELLGFLALFVLGSLPFSWYPIMERNLYSGDEPWQLFGNSEERVRYFITALKKKNPRNSRYRRSIGDGKGTWKAQDKGKAISRSGKIIGYKRSLRYENKGSEHDGQWLMKEYYFPDKVRENLNLLSRVPDKEESQKYSFYLQVFLLQPVVKIAVSLRDTVLCRIKRKQNWDNTNHNESTIAEGIRDIIGDFTPKLEPSESDTTRTTLTLALSTDD
ncbi:NAC domain-containing protein 105-like [Ipomoea triloba]|uniref:NAC domain-containing protein 105-like n=1 Tax=Ipomoea triloba TaxID=35885 RepID=UPI00125D2CE4|nr:NAC domain-containing protein 105-like [Ipomoea triloba]